MPTKIIAPPKRKGGRPADLTELQGFISLFTELPTDSTEWVQADFRGSTEKRNQVSTKRQQYETALEKHFGYKFQSRGYTDPDNDKVFRFALAFARDDNGNLILPDGSPDATAADGKPQDLAVPGK